MTEALSLSLRAWPIKDPNLDSLANLIPRINEQRGAFRNVTESSLEEEIRALEAGGAHAEDREPTIVMGEGQDTKSEREDILAAREDILKQVAQAQMEALYALDFVSLLLSKDTPRQAEISMSPHLKQSVPVSSLGLDITRLPQPSETEKRDAQLVSQGWKLEGLASAADSLLRSASRLEHEIEQETTYWGQILSVKQQGWSICRLPRERHTLGVRYGFVEAAPDFRDRGLAALRRGVDGNTVLDQGLTVSHHKTLRVQIRDRSVLVGTSSLPGVSGNVDNPIEELILRARNNIFEEELFHEINREARTLACQVVYSLDNVIHVPSLDDGEVLIDMVPLSSGLTQSGVSSGEEDKLAESIALSLRILLSYAHRQNLRRRSQLPPPLTERKPPRVIYAILRPILTYLQHQSALTATRRSLRVMLRPFVAAGLRCDFDVATLSSLKPMTLVEVNTDPGKAQVETLIDALNRPLESSVTITLPALTKLDVRIRTHLYPPTLGTDYIVTANATAPPSIPSTINFTSASDFEEHLLHLFTLDIVTTIVNFPPAGNAEIQSDTWLATDAHSGELTKSFSDLGKSKRMVISVLRDKLEIKWGWMNGKPEQGSYVWDEDRVDLKTLQKIVEEVGVYATKK